MGLLGNRVQRVEDERMVTGAATYVGDLQLDNAAQVVFVRSTMAHATIAGIDTSEALAAPGVLAVFTAADIHNPTLPLSTPLHPDTMLRSLLATDTVRFAGEPIAAVVAASVYKAIDAAELVVVDYEPLDAVVDPRHAEESATLLFPDHGSNLAIDMAPRSEVSFDDCEVVVSAEILNQRLSACPIEPRVSAAWWDDDGRLVQYLACQGAHPARATYAKMHGLDLDQVRVVVPDVGGGFGSKAGPYPEDILLGQFAKQLDRPVMWAESRTENLLAMGHGRGQVQSITLGGTAEGRLTHYQLRILQDAGAYPSSGAGLPFITGMMAQGVYEIAELSHGARSVVTNTTPVVAYRGAGRPEATAAIERGIDLFAAECGLDPAEVRRTNFIAPEDFPRTFNGMITYDTGEYAKVLDKVLEAGGYTALRAEQQRRRAAGERVVLGLGLACYVEITAPMGDRREYGAAELTPEGNFVIRTGSTPYGQGHVTTWAMLAADEFGVGMDRIAVVHGDTDLVPSGEVTGGSRSVQLAGSAVVDASGKLIDAARSVAAELLEAAVDDVVHDADTGGFSVQGTPAVAVDWTQVAEAATTPVAGVSDFQQSDATYPFGTHLAVVEVDLDTGSVDLQRVIAADDAGTIVNPLIAEGQRHGGIAQGAAQALMEECVYDEFGNPLSSNLADFAAISTMELPSFELVDSETPTPLNPIGAKGIGEAATIGATPAVQNAVIDALAHLGVRHIDMPLTAERVWRAIPGNGDQR